MDSQESEQCQITQGLVKSTLDNKEECCLCGSNSRSLMGMYRGKDDLGIISLNNWYVLDMGVGKAEDETMSGQNSSRDYSDRRRRLYFSCGSKPCSKDLRGADRIR